MNEVIFLVEEAPEADFIARAVGHAIFSQAESLEALRNRVRDSVKCPFEEGKTPKVIRLYFLRDEFPLDG